MLLQIFVSVSVDSLFLNCSRMCLWQLCINHIDILYLILCLWGFVACLDSMLHVVIMHSSSLSLTWYWLNEFVRESSHLILLEIFPGLLCFNWFRVSRDTWLICYTPSMPSFKWWLIRFSLSKCIFFELEIHRLLICSLFWLLLDDFQSFSLSYKVNKGFL